MRILAAILAMISTAAPLRAAGKSGAKTERTTEGKIATAKEKAAAEQAKTAAFIFEEREALAKLQAMDIFPDMEEGESDFAKAVAAEVETLQRESPAFFKSPAWPLHAARKVAARMSVKPLSVAEIRKRIGEEFAVKGEAFQQVHGMQIVSAKLTVGDETLDVTAQLAGHVNEQGFVVDCDASLLAALTDIAQFERTEGEANADYWKRQKKLLTAVADAREGEESLEIQFEFHSEIVTAAAKSGERLTISEEGKVSISKIAPAGHMVRATGPNDEPRKTPRKSSKPGGAKK